MKSDLFGRCWEFLAKTCSPDLPDAEEARALADFVRAEVGRAADSSLDDSAPLVLYFGTEGDRAEFVEAVKLANPGMVARYWPN